MHYRRLPNLIEKPKLIIVAFLVFFIISACNTSKNYKTLSFFFDGVPMPPADTNLLPLSNNKDTIAVAQNNIKKEPTQLFHPPFKNNNCNSCHNQLQSGKLNQDMPGVCYTCHEDYKTKYKNLHGPVGGGQCTGCHNPHSSTNEKLLERTGQSLCLYCHEKAVIMKIEVHAEINETNCTDCHNPHGGEEKTLLR